MKKQNFKIKASFLKKFFIKFSRLIGYEIIDQGNFYVPTQDKKISDNLSIQGKKSISLPLGEIKITRKVKELSIIFRSCTKVNMLTQNKKRLFNKEKFEYTFRSLNSIIFSLKDAKEKMPLVDFNIIVIDHNSDTNHIDQIKKMLNNSGFKNSFISLDVSEFKNEINKLNEENKPVSSNQISNMSNINKSFLIAKNECKDLIYFVEDDYIHSKDSISEMIFSYERISSQIKRELILCPTDYPYLYSNMENTNIFLGSTRHWRVVKESLCTFLTSNLILEKHWNVFLKMCKFEHYPFEKPLHKIYETEYCLSPIPSLSIHCTNINSIYGLSPNTNWEKIWEENKY